MGFYSFYSLTYFCSRWYTDQHETVVQYMYGLKGAALIKFKWNAKLRVYTYMYLALLDNYFLVFFSSKRDS